VSAITLWDFCGVEVYMAGFGMILQKEEPSPSSAITPELASGAEYIFCKVVALRRIPGELVVGVVDVALLADTDGAGVLVDT